MRDFGIFTGKQLAYLSLETPGGALKAAAEQEDLGEPALSVTIFCQLLLPVVSSSLTLHQSVTAPTKLSYEE